MSNAQSQRETRRALVTLNGHAQSRTDITLTFRRSRTAKCRPLFRPRATEAAISFELTSLFALRLPLRNYREARRREDGVPDRATLAVITGLASILGFAVRKGRVAYIAKEIHSKMKIVVNCYIHNVDWNVLNAWLLVFDGRDDTPEAIVAALNEDAKINGAFVLVCFDTFQAGFAATAQ
jgi:hypothetical protein